MIILTSVTNKCYFNYTNMTDLIKELGIARYLRNHTYADLAHLYAKQYGGKEVSHTAFNLVASGKSQSKNLRPFIEQYIIGTRKEFPMLYGKLLSKQNGHQNKSIPVK